MKNKCTDVEQHFHRMISGINMQLEVLPSPADMWLLSLFQGNSVHGLFFLKAVMRGFFEKRILFVFDRQSCHVSNNIRRQSCILQLSVYFFVCFCFLKRVIGWHRAPQNQLKSFHLACDPFIHFSYRAWQHPPCRAQVPTKRGAKGNILLTQRSKSTEKPTVLR